MKITTLLAVAMTAISGVACGQVSIVQTMPFSGLPGFTEPLLFNKYSGNPADLTDIQISFTLTIQGGQFVVDNDSTMPATTTVNFGASLYATSPDVLLYNSLLQPIIDNAEAVNSQTFSLGANAGDGLYDYDPTPTDGGKLIGTTQTTGGGDSVSALLFSQYLGSGTFTINARTEQVGDLSYRSGIETASTPVSASGSITVTYLAVPEPSAALLGGLSTLGLLLRRRRA